MARRLERGRPSRLQFQVMELAAGGLSEQEIQERLHLPAAALRIALARLGDLLAPQPRSLFDAMEIARSHETHQFYELNEMRKLA